MSPGRAQLSPAQPCSALPRPFQSRSDRPCVDQVRKSSSGITTTTRSPGARQAAKSFPRSSPRTCRRRTTFFCFVVSVCVCVRVRVRVGFWVAMADQGQTPGRPLVTTSAGRSSNTLRGPSGSWPGKFTKPQTCTSRRAKRQPNRRHQLTCHSGRWLERPPCAKRVHGKPP